MKLNFEMIQSMLKGEYEENYELDSYFWKHESAVQNIQSADLDKMLSGSESLHFFMTKVFSEGSQKYLGTERPKSMDSSGNCTSH